MKGSSDAPTPRAYSITSRSVYSNVVAGSSVPTTSDPIGLRSAIVLAHCRRRLQALGDLVESVRELLGAAQIADLREVVPDVLQRRVRQDRALALNNRRATEVSSARCEDLAGHSTLFRAEVRHHRGHQFRLQLLQDRGRHDVLGQPGSGD